LASCAFCCASLVCSAFISSASRWSVSGIVDLPLGVRLDGPTQGPRRQKRDVSRAGMRPD
jgi:hypothetical protein